jgi:hypothetical protein
MVSPPMFRNAKQNVPTIVSCRLTDSSRDVDVTDRLLRLPLGWFVQLVRNARDRCVSAAQLTLLIERYINAAIERHDGNRRRRVGDAENEAGRKQSGRDGGSDDDATGPRTNGLAEKHETTDGGGEDEDDDDEEEEEEDDGEEDEEAEEGEEEEDERERRLRETGEALAARSVNDCSQPETRKRASTIVFLFGYR